ncbi:cell division protein FtsK [Streptomyces sp. NPDC090442]|uniref:cell division protein FtsK n=1 Tax=Streptomyces sp. NPDC090442 TaxID=3365962 RepID=UPI0038139B9C
MTSQQTAMSIQALRNRVRLTDPYTAAALSHLAEPLMGLADGDHPITLPEGCGHLLIATGSGGGTTTLLRTLAAQALGRGARVDLIDPSGTGHPWATHLPRLTYLSRIDAIHDHLLLIAASLRDNTGHHAGAWEQRRVLVIENASTVAYALRQFWMHTRPETQLQEPPGVEALALLLAAGPSAGIQVLAGSPRGTLPGLGSTPVREVFPTRVLAYGAMTLWQRVAPEVWPVPPYSITPGRMHVVEGGTCTVMQALTLTDPEARALARGHLPTAAPPPRTKQHQRKESSR